MQKGNVANRDVAAILQADGFVAHARAGFASAARQPLAPDQAGTQDRYIVQPFAPNQSVVPMAVAEVLILVPGVRLGRVITPALAIFGGQDRRAMIEV